ncbi:unnamed protein product [Prorocentrum cordatum]|uniref:Uncharacterized protein n=1 Tax=Prorocentrum cordatum TaxID=2364126 RepID=A0ABN9S4B5_9DINO|nr:unnamed protein product [Polarella glacialis]
MEFFIASLHHIFVEGENKGFSAAYAETLSNYHSGMTAFGAKALLMAMPGKEGICALESICPEAPDVNSRTACICHDMFEMTTAVLPVVRKMIAIMKEMDLWEDGRV